MSNAIDHRRHPGLPRRVLFLNDVSFQYGAGVAQARQVEALLSLGIETGVLAWAPGEIELEAVATRVVEPDLWLGIRAVDHLEGGKKLSDAGVIAGLVTEVARFNPDVVLVGNLHAAKWPFELLPALRRLGCRVITFLHDAYLYTGRCAYPGDCKLYLTGCTAECPTADHYPKLSPALIPAAWRLRREIFGGPHGIDVVANSQWSRRMFLTALPQAHGVETVELAADETIYCPADKNAARQMLGLRTDKPVVLCAAVNFQEERKGGPHLREIVATLQGEVHFAAFGHNASDIPGITGLGYHLRADRLALIYQAADLFLGTATEEAFGQTVMEAQLCGVPAVVFHAGGVVEIVRHNVTGLVVPNANAPAAVAAIRSLLAAPQKLEEFGRLARHRAAARFSLPAHAARWCDYFVGRRHTWRGHNPAVLAYPLHESEDLRSVDRHRASWPTSSDLLTDEHAQSALPSAAQDGPRHAGERLKLYEMGYHAGDVILEIGSLGGSAATLALRGALANPARTLPPLYFGLTQSSLAVEDTRAALVSAGLGDHCHLLESSLEEFFGRWQDQPTMVFVHQRTADGALVDALKLLSQKLQPGTPVLLSGYLANGQTASRSVRLAADQWSGEGAAKFMGCFGQSALYVTSS